MIKRSSCSQNKFSAHSLLSSVAILAATCFFLSCGGTSNSNSSPTTPTPTTQNVSISVSPIGATIAPNTTQQFTATVSGTSNTSVTWSAGGAQGGNSTVGTISSSGLYTAPATVPNPSAVNILAVAAADTTKSASATVNVLAHHINQDFQNPPIKLGTSGGNATDKTTTTDKTTGKTEIFCCSGTLGSLISRGGTFYVLSNNHVLDKSDQGAPGDPVSQPGLADTNCGQRNNTVVANLTESAALKTSNVDAAMAQVVSGDVDATGAILDLAAPGQPAPPSATIASAAIGQHVAKSGDATGLTCANVNAVSLAVKVDYTTQCQGGSTFTVIFQNQVGVEGPNFSNSGDSGSLIVTTDTARPIAMLYAGSTTGSVGNPIQDVLTALKDPNSGEIPKMVGGSDHLVACPASPQTVITQNATEFRQMSRAQIARASAVRDLHGAELMQDPAVTSVDVGQSDDNPNEPAILVFLKGRPRVPIPVQVEGIRTKVIRRPEVAAQESPNLRDALPGISDTEFARARVAKERHATEMMAESSVLGVGVGASKDNAIEAAMVVFVEKGKQAKIPVEIDGVRTRIIETDRFRTFNWGKRTQTSCSRR
jgi:hypothetical protein